MKGGKHHWIGMNKEILVKYNLSLYHIYIWYRIITYRYIISIYGINSPFTLGKPDSIQSVPYFNFKFFIPAHTKSEGR